jgi:hypothetical protein
VLKRMELRSKPAKGPAASRLEEISRDLPLPPLPATEDRQTCGVNVFLHPWCECVYFVFDICCVALLCGLYMAQTAMTPSTQMGRAVMSLRATSDGVRCRFHSEQCAVPYGMLPCH